MKKQIISHDLRKMLGSAFVELGKKVVAYDPDMICPILRGGRYVLDGVEYFIEEKYGKTFPSMNIVHFVPPLDPFSDKKEYTMNKLELKRSKDEIRDRRIAIVDDLRWRSKTLKRAKSRLFELGALEVKGFCLYNDTSLRNKVTMSDFHDYWHGVVVSIGDLVPWKRHYHIDGRHVQEITFVSAEEALEKLNDKNLAGASRLYNWRYNQSLTRELLMNARKRRRLLKSEMEMIINEHVND
jgi:hypoxanthine phosphoribosyltransferase